MSQMKELDKTTRDINEVDTSDGEVKVMIIKIQDLRKERRISVRQLTEMKNKINEIKNTFDGQHLGGSVT